MVVAVILKEAVLVPAIAKVLIAPREVTHDTEDVPAAVITPLKPVLAWKLAVLVPAAVKVLVNSVFVFSVTLDVPGIEKTEGALFSGN